MLTSKCWHLFKRNWVVIVKLVLCSAVAMELVVHGIAKWFLEETRWLENSTEWRSGERFDYLPRFSRGCCGAVPVLKSGTATKLTKWTSHTNNSSTRVYSLLGVLSCALFSGFGGESFFNC